MQSSNSPKYLIGSLIVIGVLFLIAHLILSNMLAIADGVVEPEPMDAEAIAERLKPVAKENIGEEQVAQAPVADETEDAAAEAGDDSVGKQVVTQVCAVCHGTGMMNSPKVGNAADWAPRIEKGMDTLYDHAINGFNLMPARGGNPKLSDDEVKAAVDYMVPKDQAPKAETPKAPAGEEKESTPEAEDNSVGKKVTTQVCATCHASGLMNSPKIGNADDWAPRIEKGMDTLYDHAINGFNIMMPARGGNPKLSDEEVKAAVDYMISSAD